MLDMNSNMIENRVNIIPQNTLDAIKDRVIKDKISDRGIKYIEDITPKDQIHDRYTPKVQICRTHNRKFEIYSTDARKYIPKVYICSIYAANFKCITHMLLPKFKYITHMA